MNQLIVFLDRYIRYAKEWDVPQRAMDQAFGGLQMFLELYPDNLTESKVTDLWYNVYKPQFEKIIYGI
jgi:hypothetical protein